MLLALHLKEKSVQNEFLESPSLLRKHQSGHRKNACYPVAPIYCRSLVSKPAAKLFPGNVLYGLQGEMSSYLFCLQS